MQLIKHIDQIAREKGRDVLYLAFHPRDPELRRNYDYRSDAMRESILEWLTAHQIAWMPCGPFANVSGFGSYNGQLYLDVPFDKELPQYTELCEFLEFPNGSMRQTGVRFYVLLLEKAMINAEHDTPGFWESWAEKF